MHDGFERGSRHKVASDGMNKCWSIVLREVARVGVVEKVTLQDSISLLSVSTSQSMSMSMSESMGKSTSESKSKSINKDLSKSVNQNISKRKNMSKSKSSARKSKSDIRQEW
jgi:hypothetical protein